MSIQVTLNFANETELVAFFTGKKAVVTIPAAQETKQAPKPEKPATTPTAGPSTAAKNETATASPSDPKGQGAAAASAPAPAAAPAASSPAPTPSAEAGAFQYETLKKKVFELLPKLGKEVVLPVAAKHGANLFKDLPADKWELAFNDLVALEGGVE